MHARRKDIHRINRCLKAACEIISEKPYCAFTNLGEIQCQKKKINKIINDKTRPLFEKKTQFSSKKVTELFTQHREHDDI